MEDERESSIKDFQVFNTSNYWVNSGTIYRNRKIRAEQVGAGAGINVVMSVPSPIPHLL